MAVYKADILDVELNTGNIARSFLCHNIGKDDTKADRFGVRVYRDGEPESLSGCSIQGYMMRPNGTNLAITGSNTGVSGNEAWVDLPQAAYDYEGQFCLALKLIGGGVTGTIRIIDGMINNTFVDDALVPMQSVPTYQEILAVYDQMVAAKNGSVRFDQSQSLTETQKSVARMNIDAANDSDVADLKSAFENIDESFEKVVSVNKFNPATAIIGVLDINTGNINTSLTNVTTSDYIDITSGDTVSLCAKGASDNYVYGTGVINALVWYDENKNYIDGTGSVNDYQITASNAKYIRLGFVNTGAFGTAKIISITLNYRPQNVSEITEYFTPYYQDGYPIAVEALGKANANDGRISVIESELSDAIVKVEPDNKYNPEADEVGMLNASTGIVDTTQSGSKTSDFIEVSPSDVVYLCGVSASDTYLYGSGIIQVLCVYNSSKERIASTTFTNGYTVNNDAAKYIRVSYSITGQFGTAKIVSLTLNNLPANVSEITEYFEPYYPNAYELANEAKALAQSALDAVGKNPNMHVIDCWGDSRTEMIWPQNTAYADYLQTKLGDDYCVVNYGRSSQASGMVAARLGSNQVFVTVDDNRILASGNTHINKLYVTSGIINNFFCYSSAAPVPCVLGGVEGAIYKTAYHNYDQCYFVRKTAGDAVSLRPREKMIVTDYSSKDHACILWWGKNDMLTSADGRAGIAKVYDDAVKYIGHDKFIILGETCSVVADYETGTVLRTFLDAFNSAMATKYPDNFIDINAWLSSTDALTSVGLTPTTEDTEFISKGWPAYQLMIYSTDTTDTVHPNEKGREAIANKIYSWMQEHNWVN